MTEKIAPSIQMTWGGLRSRVDAQMSTDPQRATLARRAMQQVEEGLTHIAGIGHNFEIVPKGTLMELLRVQSKAPETLSIVEAVEKVAAPEPEQRNLFEAKAS